MEEENNFVEAIKNEATGQKKEESKVVPKENNFIDAIKERAKVELKDISDGLAEKKSFVTSIKEGVANRVNTKENETPVEPEKKSFVTSIKEGVSNRVNSKEKVTPVEPEEKSFADAIKQNMKDGIKSRVKKKVMTDSHASDDSHVFDRMADVMYGMTTKMPLVGKYAKIPLDKIDALNNTKMFTSKVFKPIFPFFKVDKKYTQKLVDEAPEHKKEEK